MRKRELQNLYDERSERVLVLEQRQETLQQQLDEYRAREKAILDSMSRVQQENAKRVKEAETKAEDVRAAAEQYADETVQNADVRAKKTLLEAQNSARSVLEEAESDAQAALLDARERSERMLGDAKAQSETLLGDAKAQSEAWLSDAKAQAESLLGQAQARAETLLRDANEERSRLIAEAEAIASEATERVQRFHMALEQRAAQARAGAESFAALLNKQYVDLTTESAQPEPPKPEGEPEAQKTREPEAAEEAEPWPEVVPRYASRVISMDEAAAQDGEEAAVPAQDDEEAADPAQVDEEAASPAQVMQNIYRLQNRDLPLTADEARPESAADACIEDASAAETAPHEDARTTEAAEPEWREMAPRPEYPQEQPEAEETPAEPVAGETDGESVPMEEIWSGVSDALNGAEEWHPASDSAGWEEPAQDEETAPTVSELIPEQEADEELSLDALLDEIIRAGE